MDIFSNNVFVTAISKNKKLLNIKTFKRCIIRIFYINDMGYYI